MSPVEDGMKAPAGFASGALPMTKASGPLVVLESSGAPTATLRAASGTRAMAAPRRKSHGALSPVAARDMRGAPFTPPIVADHQIHASAKGRNAAMTGSARYEIPNASPAMTADRLHPGWARPS